MVKDIFKVQERVKGHIVVKARKPGGEWEVIVDRKNAITANAPTLISKALAGETGWVINRIECLKASAQLAIETVSKSYPSAGKVQFESTFGLTSFNDTLDELRLTSLDGGNFSTVTGLSIAKSDEVELNIQWLLSII